MNSFKTALAMFGIAFALAVVGPSLDDHSAENDTAKDSIRQLKEVERFERTVQALCGENAAWTDLGNGVIQCLNKRGRKTTLVSLGGV